MINTIVNKNRLHVANDANYQGSINSYNNGFTKSFSKLFGISSKIKINDETKCVNKKSYRKLLAALDLTPSKNEPMKNFDTLSCSFRKDQGLMREHISSKKGDKLGKEFIRAILANDMQKATDLIGKGAQIDKHFWVREHHGLSFKHLTDGLSDQSLSPFKAVRYTPFLCAVDNKNQKLRKLLEQYQANQGLTGEACEFERKILNVHYQTNFQNAYRSDGYFDTNVVSTTRIVDGQDYYRGCSQLSYNATENTLDSQKVQDRAEHWSKASNSPASGVQVATEALWFGVAIANAFSGR
jgi:hypothetical protein